MSESPVCFYRVIDDFFHAFEHDHGPARLGFSIGNIHMGTNMKVFLNIYMHIQNQMDTTYTVLYRNGLYSERLLRGRSELMAMIVARNNET